MRMLTSRKRLSLRMRSNAGSLEPIEGDRVLCFSDGVCPLCSEVFPLSLLHEHIQSEDARLRGSTVQVIQAYHGGWLEEHGACEPCWKSYRDAGQILSLMKRQTVYR